MYTSQFFTFDGISSEDYDLMIYFFNDQSVIDVNFGTNVTPIEERLPSRVDPIHYGVNMNESFSFPLTFGSTKYLNEYDVEEIIQWLTGHQQYKWLEFEDYNANPVRYKCRMNNVQTEEVNGIPVAFTVDVECDSQFGYEYPHLFSYEDISSGGLTTTLFNHSTYNGYLYPQMEIECGNGVSKITITNNSDNDRAFEINTESLSGLVLNIDNKNGIITHDGTGALENYNFYPFFNMKFFRLLQGKNEITIEPTGGTCTVNITCEFMRKAVGH